MNQPRQTLTAPIRRIRFVWVAVFFMFWTGLIGLRLVWLQVVRHGDWQKRATMQQQRTFEVAPRRGVLYDRNLRELAVTVSAESVYAVPSELGENRAMAANMLAQVVHSDPSDSFTSEHGILGRLNASRNFAWVARKLTPEQAIRVKELNLKGVYLQKEFKRFYPNSDLAAQILGYVGTDDAGLGGLERQFDDDLHGTPGHMLTALDAKRHARGSEEREPLPGENLVLSIDMNIQYIAERALDHQMEKTKSKHGVIVVQDPYTGQILALAIAPRFNPNDLRHQDSSVLKNLAVSDVYEPGSTFKLVTYSAALDGAGVEPDDIVDCLGGAITMFGRTIHDDKSDGHMGKVTVHKALEKSSDVGAVQMALKVGPNKFYNYIRGFGFGDRSGIELPSETRGLLRKPSKWGATSIGSIAMGQEVAVTPIQLVTMVSTLANGGVYLPPHIILNETEMMRGDSRLKPLTFRPGNQLPNPLPDGAHRVVSELTSAKMRKMMQGIVTDGSGIPAALNGYSAGGKTGTAQKIDVVTHTYSKTQHIASFAGMAPVSNPAITVAVILDSPAGAQYYGTQVSAPVFQEVAQQVLEYMGVPHDQPLKAKSKVQLAAASQPIDEDIEDKGADLNAMFADVNALPADDPLRGSDKTDSAVPQTSGASNTTTSATSNAILTAASPASSSVVKPGAKTGIFAALPEKILTAFRQHGGSSLMSGEDDEKSPLPHPTESTSGRADGAVVVDATHKVAVPDFSGAAMRAVVERAQGAGLRVQAMGSGLAREQAPIAGTMVPAGTEVIVRFAR